MSLSRWGAVIGVLVLTAWAARADEAREQQAKQLYLDGKKAYDSHEYGRAVELFKRAYRALPNPALLYNIASAQQGQEHPHEAADTLRSYLRAVPDDNDRPAIEARIRALEESQRLLDEERAAAERDRPTPPPPVETPKPAVEAPKPPPEPVIEAPIATPVVAPSHPGRAKTYAGAAVGALGVAALIGGIVASVSAKSAGDSVRAEAAAMQPFDPALESAGRRDDTVAYAMYGIGAAAVVTGVILVVLGRRDAVRARAQLAPASGGAAVGVHF